MAWVRPIRGAFLAQVGTGWEQGGQRLGMGWSLDGHRLAQGGDRVGSRFLVYWAKIEHWCKEATPVFGGL